MDRIRKFLNKLSPKERITVEEIIECVLRRDLVGFDVKKLRGNQQEFRVRKGNIRIIFSMDGNEVFVQKIERRGDTTYR